MLPQTRLTSTSVAILFAIELRFGLLSESSWSGERCSRLIARGARVESGDV